MYMYVKFYYRVLKVIEESPGFKVPQVLMDK